MHSDELEEEVEEDEDEILYQDLKQFLRLSDLTSSNLSIPMGGDGNCLFRALAFWKFGDQERHDDIRSRIVKFLTDHPDIVLNSYWAKYFNHNLDKLKDYTARVNEKDSSGDLTCLYIASLVYKNFKFKIWTSAATVRTHRERLELAGVNANLMEGLLCLEHDNITDDTTYLSNVWNLGGHRVDDILNLHFHGSHYNVLNLKDLAESSFISPHCAIHLEDAEEGSEMSNVDNDLFISENSRLEEAKNKFVSNNLPCCSPQSNRGVLQDDGSQVVFSMETVDKILGKRTKHIRLSVTEATKLMSYRCEHKGADASFCQFEVCAASGVAYEARNDVWGPEENDNATGTRRRDFMVKSLRDAMTIVDGKPVYRHKVGQYMLCHDAWKKLFGWSSSSLNRWKALVKAEKLVDVELNSTGISLNARVDSVEWVTRDDTPAARIAYAFFFHYVQNCCDKLPVGYISQFVQNELKLTASYKTNTDLYQKFLRETSALEKKMRARSESLPFDVNLEEQIAKAKGLLREKFRDEHLQAFESVYAQDQTNGVEEQKEVEVVDESMFFGELNDDGSVDTCPKGFFPNEAGDTTLNDASGEMEQDQMCQYRVPYATRKEVYDEYVQFCAFSDNEKVSANTFTEMWKKEFSFVKLSKVKGTFSMCGTCKDCTGKMKKAKTDKEYTYWKQKRGEHLDQQRAQRLEYYKNRIGATLYKDRSISIILDAMDQAKTDLPVEFRRAGKKEHLGQKLMGAIAHGHGNFLYVSHKPVINGADFTLECLWRTLIKLESAYQENGWTWPPKLDLQFDNCRDNKNKCVVAFCSLLVETDVFSEVNFNFLMIGHTHEDIDQMFSVISRRFQRLCFHPRSRKCVTFEDFQKEIMSCFTGTDKYKPKCVELVVATHNFWKWFGEGIDPKFGNMDAMRAFQFRKQTAEEEGLHTFRQFDGKCAIFGRQFMTTKLHECTPSRKRMASTGPVIPLMYIDDPFAFSFTKPELSEFKDYKKKGSKKTKVDPTHATLTNQEICEGKFEALRDLIKDYAGATREQRNEFIQMIDEKAYTVKNLSDDVVNAYVPKFRWIWNLNALHRGEVEVDFEKAEEEDELLAFTSWNEDNRKEKRERAKHKLMVENQKEMRRKTMFEPIEAGEFLLCKMLTGERKKGEDEETSGDEETGGDEKTGGDEETLPEFEWLVAKAIQTVPEVERSDTETVQVHWYRSDVKTINDLNGRYSAWKTKISKRETVDETQHLPRTCIQAVGLGIIKTRHISVRSKRNIATLGVGFKMDVDNKTLIWNGERSTTDALEEAEEVEQLEV